MRSYRPRSVAPLALVLVACAAAPLPEGPGPAKPTASAKLGGVPPTPPDPCTPDVRKPKSTPALELRSKGVDALASGKVQQALKAFTDAMDRVPNDVVSFALSTAATADLAEERVRSGRSFGRLKPLVVDSLAPPHKTLAPKAVAAPAATLARDGEESHYGDWFGWVAGQGLTNPIEFGVNGEVPAIFGQTFGEQPVFATYMKPSVGVVRYGPGLLVVGKDGTGVRALQLEPLIAAAFAASTKSGAPDTVWPEVRFVDVVGSLLIATIAHDGDGQKIKPEGFLVAFDLEADKVAWVSDAGAGNAHASYATGTHIVTAFSEGTTSKVNVIDVATGAVVSSETVPDRVYYLVGDGAKVWAWTNSKVHRFKLSSFSAVPEARVGAVVRDGEGPRSGLDDTQRCWLANAVIALDHRDGPAVLAATDHLPSDLSARKALEAAGEFLIAKAGGAKGLDLTELTPILAEAPSGPLQGKDSGPKLPAPKRLVPVKDPAIEPLKPPFMESPAPLYSTARLDLFPMRYANSHLEGAFMHGDRTVLNYGRRFVVTIEGDEVKSIVDLKPLLTNPAGATSATLYFFTVLEGVVYGVVLPPGSATSFLVALDPLTGKVLWKSPATFVARPFQVFGGYILAAQNPGKGGELVMMRPSDGQVVSTTKTKEAVHDFGWDGRGALYVMLPAKREHFILK